jgi:hypothetical protein
MTDVFAGVPFIAQDLPAVARHAFDQARANPGVFRLLAWATLEHSAAAMPPARKHEYDRTLALVREQQESGTIRNNAPPELILMSVLTLATAWSPDFPFGEAAAPDTGLSPDAVRDWIADMVGRIAGQNLAVRPLTRPGRTRTGLRQAGCVSRQRAATYDDFGMRAVAATAREPFDLAIVELDAEAIVDAAERSTLWWPANAG